MKDWNMRYLLGFLIFSQIAFAAETSSQGSGAVGDVQKVENEQSGHGSSQKPVLNSYIMCRNDKAVRTLRIDVKDGACQAFYTKLGQEQLVAKSGTPDKCIEVVNQIRQTLEKSIWKCKDVEPERVSFTLE